MYFSYTKIQRQAKKKKIVTKLAFLETILQLYTQGWVCYFTKQLPGKKAISPNKKMFLLLKLLQLKMSNNPTETPNPDIPRLWDCSQRKWSPTIMTTKIKMILGSGEKLKRRGEVVYHEVMRPSATFSTKISEAAELGGICYLGSLLLFPHLDS